MDLTEKEIKERDELTVKRVRVLAKVLDCETGIPDDATIIGCMGTVLGMFRARVERLQQMKKNLRNAIIAEAEDEGNPEACTCECCMSKRERLARVLEVNRA